MPIDYSKWDNVELSDDSDIEVHPNVDKRSFIKWKQQDIHQKREQRNHDIKQLEIQIPMYEELNKRANKMLSELSDEQLGDFEGVKAYLSKTFDNAKPANPTLSAEDYAEQPTYSEMIEDLFIQLKNQLREAKKDPNSGTNLRTEIINHHKKITDVLTQSKEKLNQLYKEKSLHISSDDIQTGWNRSFLNTKDKENENVKKQAQPNSAATTCTTTSSSVQSSLLSATESESAITQTSSVSTALTPPTSKPVARQQQANDDGHEAEAPQIHPDTVKLSLIPINNHQKISDFLSNHTYIINPQQKDALLMTAFDAQFAHEPTRTKQIIYHSCLMQYVLDIMQYQNISNPIQIKIVVEQLFKKIFSNNSNPALTALDNEVASTFEHIKTRCEILSRNDEEKDEEDEDENAQIQLKSLDDNVELKVDIPEPEDQERYEAFSKLLPIDMQRAMKTGSLDAVNEVFKNIPFREAETILEVFQDYGFISVQEGVIENENEWNEIQEQYQHEHQQEDHGLNSKVEKLEVHEKDEETFVSTADIID